MGGNPLEAGNERTFRAALKGGIPELVNIPNLNRRQVSSVWTLKDKYWQGSDLEGFTLVQSLALRAANIALEQRIVDEADKDYACKALRNVTNTADRAGFKDIANKTETMYHTISCK
jgi:hypothetical protein